MLLFVLSMCIENDFSEYTNNFYLYFHLCISMINANTSLNILFQSSEIDFG